MRKPTVYQWTNKKQQRLEEIERERADLLEQQQGARRKIAEAFGDFRLTEKDIDHMIRRADAIRDALDPFDSGMRDGVPLRAHAVEVVSARLANTYGVSKHDALEDVPFPKGAPPQTALVATPFGIIDVNAASGVDLDKVGRHYGLMPRIPGEADDTYRNRIIQGVPK